MKVRALQAVGQHKVGDEIEVLSDDVQDRFIKDGKPLAGLSQSRADELLQSGAVESVEADKPKTKTTTKARQGE